MKIKKKPLLSIVAVLAVVTVITIGGSFYMLSYSLTPDPNRRDIDSAMQVMFKRAPFMKAWTDSVKANGLLRDTFITRYDGRRLHAVYMRNENAHGRTAIIVHGYKDCHATFLYLGRMYHKYLNCNILLPDLHAHGLSDGESIQMGWKDREDILDWANVADKIFRDEKKQSAIVIHGVSMGAAATMCTAGERSPITIRCFIEDSGYTSVWDEFSKELREQFSLPEFPLMYSASVICKLKNGWSFGEASPLKLMRWSIDPILFIHGDKDTFVPTWMAHKLYETKTYSKQLWIAPGSEHARAYLDHPEEYTQKVKDFLDMHMLQPDLYSPMHDLYHNMRIPR
ncbi:alpha/beta hydrolase [Palleniella muris]|uniref:Alpha/beta hydrolase n=1 Tax=Palleniella muris TaxID=3038145 RepID=A0AC61QR13_9BACT|nr:alpha/beta hydrolase [Palleniella muris]TGX82482.1 alpha/beta hydrolase [Palleniella muris]